MKVTIVICTYNRPELLQGLLESLDRLSAPRDNFDVLIVDNSEQQAPVRRIVSAHRTDITIRLMHTSPPGLSRARNAGLRAARGKYVAFLDDDARPSSGWIEALLAAFGSDFNVVAAGGPVLPLWPAAIPPWVSRYSEAALSVLDRGGLNASLRKGQHLYGANMAVDRRRALAAGAFDEDLGRTGGSLLSNEDVDLQERLRRTGGKVVYSSDAVVLHMVHHDRIDRGWLRRRMGWQGASDAMEAGQVSDFDSHVEGVASHAAQLGIDGSFLRAFAKSDDPALVDTQLKFIRSLAHLLLSAQGDLGEADLERLQILFAEQVQPAAAPPAAPRPPRRSSSLPGSLARQYAIFFEGAPGHRYLYDAYATAIPSRLIAPTIDPWDYSERGIEETKRALRGASTNAHEMDVPFVLITLDPLLHPRLSRELAVISRSLDGRVAAILHRIPKSVPEIRSLIELSRELRIVVLAEELAAALQRRFGIEASVLPHHPTIWSLPRPSAGLGSGDSCVVSMLGEVRHGKGLELVVSAIGKIPRSVAGRIRMQFGGRSDEASRLMVEKAVRKAGIEAGIQLRTAPRRRYAVLTDIEYANMIHATDVGLLLYQHDQRTVMSGVLPNYAAAGAPVIATRSSFVGSIVDRHNLGRTIENETPAALAKAIVALADPAARAAHAQSEGFKRYVRETSVSAVGERLRELLNFERGNPE